MGLPRRLVLHSVVYPFDHPLSFPIHEEEIRALFCADAQVDARAVEFILLPPSPANHPWARSFFDLEDSSCSEDASQALGDLLSFSFEAQETSLRRDNPPGVHNDGFALDAEEFDRHGRIEESRGGGVDAPLPLPFAGHEGLFAIRPGEEANAGAWVPSALESGDAHSFDSEEGLEPFDAFFDFRVFIVFSPERNGGDAPIGRKGREDDGLGPSAGSFLCSEQLGPAFELPSHTFNDAIGVEKIHSLPASTASSFPRGFDGHCEGVGLQSSARESFCQFNGGTPNGKEDLIDRMGGFVDLDFDAAVLHDPLGRAKSLLPAGGEVDQRLCDRTETREDLSSSKIQEFPAACNPKVVEKKDPLFPFFLQSRRKERQALPKRAGPEEFEGLLRRDDPVEFRCGEGGERPFGDPDEGFQSREITDRFHECTRGFFFSSVPTRSTSGRRPGHTWTQGDDSGGNRVESFKDGLESATLPVLVSWKDDELGAQVLGCDDSHSRADSRFSGEHGGAFDLLFPGDGSRSPRRKIEDEGGQGPIGNPQAQASHEATALEGESS